MRLKKPLVGIAAMSLAVLAACGNNDNNQSGGESPDDIKSQLDSNSGGGLDPDAVGPLVIEGAEAGGTVKVLAQSGNLSTEFDPRGVYYADMMSVQTSLFIRTLTQYKFVDGQVVVVPDMATDLGTANEDYTEWTFTLKDGIKYSNGDDVVAADIAHSVATSMDCSTFTDCPSFYLLDSLEGADTYEPGKMPAGISTPDDKTIVFTFAKPFPDLSYYATFPLFGAVPADDPKLTEPGNYANNVLSTGPYMIEDRVPQKSMTLVRNPNWDAATDPGRAALPDVWEFDTTSTDLKQQDAIVMSDEGANVLTIEDVESSDLQTFQNDFPDQLASGPQPLTLWLAPLYQDLGKNKAVPLEARQALTWAWPYEAAAKAAGLTWGVNRIPTTTLIAPGTPGRSEVNAMPDHAAGVTDTAKAKAILEEAGLVGYEIRWLYSTDDPLSVAAMKVVRESLEEAGFSPKPYATTTTNASADRANPATPINVRSGGWFSDWPSGYTWIPTIFGPGNDDACADQKWESFGVVNYAAFCEDDVQAKIAEVNALPSDEQAAAWSDLEKYIQETYYPVIPTSNGATVQAHGTALQNVHIDVSIGMPAMKVIWVQQ